MYSILYSIDGAIYKIGPFDCSYEAINAALKANEDREFDIFHVYLFCHIGGKMIELCESDLVYTEVQ